MKQSELAEEIHVMIEELLRDGQPVKKSWIKHEILSRHQSIDGEDRDWYLLCGAEHVDGTVNKVIQTYKAKPQDPDPQSVLPGFDRLQKAYLIARDGEQTIVPVHQLTASEMEEKEHEYRAMGAGCYAHADELKRYRQQREAA